jgi:hypothetical protein
VIIGRSKSTTLIFDDSAGGLALCSRLRSCRIPG